MQGNYTLRRFIAELEKLKKENGEYRQIARNQINFNRKLCSENRKRRLANNQHKKQEQDRLIQLQIAKGSTLELKKLINRLQITLEQKERQNMDWEDEILILRTDITRLNQKLEELGDHSKGLERKYKEKCKEYDNLFKNSYRQAQTSKITPNGADFDEQLMGLINQNCELQRKIKDNKQMIDAYHEKIRRMELQIKDMADQIESKNEIISAISQQDEKQKNNQRNGSKSQSNPQIITPFQKLLTEILAINTDNGQKRKQPQRDHKTEQGWQQQRPGKTPIYQNLRIKVQEYCRDYEHLLYSDTNIENISENSVTLNYCQAIRTNVEGIWKSRIKIISEGELYFGVADARFSYIEVMKPLRNFVYYNNCTGAVVVNRDGKLLEVFANRGDILQLMISLKSDKKEIMFAKNDKPFYTLPYPQCFKNSQKLLLFVKLFSFMALDFD